MTEYVVYITLGILAVLVLKPIVGLIVLWIKLKLEELQIKRNTEEAKKVA